jgi:hypothetical protein
VSRYPVMPPGTCRESSWTLAACYRDLRYVEGHRTLVLRVTDGRVIRDKIEHAWNVTASGEIVDSTLGPHLLAEAEARRAELVYEATDPASWWPASIPAEAGAMAAAARSQTNGMSPAERRKTVEAFGRMFTDPLAGKDGAK